MRHAVLKNCLLVFVVLGVAANGLYFPAGKPEEQKAEGEIKFCANLAAVFTIVNEPNRQGSPNLRKLPADFGSFQAKDIEQDSRCSRVCQSVINFIRSDNSRMDSLFSLRCLLTV